MGIAAARATSRLLNTEENALTQFAGTRPYALDDPLYVRLVAFRQPLHLVDPADLHVATRSYCAELGESRRCVCGGWKCVPWPRGTPRCAVCFLRPRCRQADVLPLPRPQWMGAALCRCL
jgi:hypothetical protein